MVNVNIKGVLTGVAAVLPTFLSQQSGLYAQTMAERGFITLAFDPSHTSER